MFSIIVPVYNIEQYIESCIKSVLKQTYEDFELVLVDDGSTDSSGKICDYYSRIDDRISCYHKENGGVSGARNYGIEKSKGDWVSFLDGDDYIADNYIEKLFEFENDNDVIISDYYLLTEKQVRPQFFFDCEQQFSDSKTELIRETMLGKRGNCTNVGVPWGKAYRKTVLLDNNILFPINISRMEDTVFNLRVFSKTNRIKYIHIPLYFYRQRMNSLAHEFDSTYYSDSVNFFMEIDNIDLVFEDKDSIIQAKRINVLLNLINNFYSCKKCSLSSEQKKDDLNALCKMISFEADDTKFEYLTSKQKLMYQFIKRKKWEYVILFSKAHRLFSLCKNRG